MVVSPAALVCNKVPPVEALYHLNVPAVELFAVTVTVPVPQREPAVAVGAVGIALTVAVMAVRGVLSHVLVLKVT